MKRIMILILMMIYTTTIVYGQWTPYDRASYAKFTPLTAQEIMLAGQLQAERNRRTNEQFSHYQDIAYKYLRQGKHYDFLQYSNYALQTGWYSSQLYYDRGASFEKIGDFKNAKREYKKAKKRGYIKASQAIRRLKKKKKYGYL